MVPRDPVHDGVPFLPGVMDLDLAFEYRGRRGKIRVRCGAVADPTTIGQTPDAEGFPICLATVLYPGQGYDAFFGWVQLVRSSDNRLAGGGFEMDPFLIHQDAPTPYAFYGHLPTLFDAPSRSRRGELTWIAHSFLGVTPFDPEMLSDLHQRSVVPLVGFSWGFNMSAHAKIEVSRVEPLVESDWVSHLPLLERAYSTWKFARSMRAVLPA